MARVMNKYPDWVEKYRQKSVTIRKTKYGYGLYRCTSRYVKGKKYPESTKVIPIPINKGFLRRLKICLNIQTYMFVFLNSVYYIFQADRIS